MRLVHDFDEFVDRRNSEGISGKKYSLDVYPADVLPMWIADTDFKAPQPIVDALTARMAEGVYGYIPLTKRMLSAASHWVKTRFGLDMPESAIEYVPGVISGVICAVRGLSRPGDNIVINTPCYPPFMDLAAHNGRHLLRNELVLKDGRYEIDFEDLEQKLADPRSKLFILCNPQNPTGRVFTLEELTRIGELCLKYHVVVLADEIHCDLVYQGYQHIPFAGIREDFAQNSITLINPSKTFNVPGFRTAVFMSKNPVLKQAVHDVIVDNKAIGENICGSIALYTAYESCAYYADQMIAYLEENKRIMEEAFAEIEQIDLIHAEGTYLFWLDCRKMGMEQKDLVDFFVTKAKLGLNDGKSFGPEGIGFMRMNIGCPKATIIEAIGRIKQALEKL